MFPCVQCSTQLFCEKCRMSTATIRMVRDQYSGGVVSYPSSTLLPASSSHQPLSFHHSSSFHLSSSLLPCNSNPDKKSNTPHHYQNVTPTVEKPEPRVQNSRSQEVISVGLTSEPGADATFVSPLSSQSLLRHQELELQNRDLDHQLRLIQMKMLKNQLELTKQQLKELEYQTQVSPRVQSSTPLLPPRIPRSLPTSALLITTSHDPFDYQPTLEVSRFNLFPASSSSSSNASERLDLEMTRLELQQCSWYHGSITWLQADQLLENKSEGTFLLRDSQYPGCLYSLSIQRAKLGPTSIRIYFSQGRFRLDSEGAIRNIMPTFPSIVDLVEYYMRRDRLYTNPGELEPDIKTKIDLRKPLLKSPPSLAHMCRLSINSCMKREEKNRHIQQLTLPVKLVQYLTSYNNTV